GEVGVYGGSARDVVLLTYGNGVPMSLRVQRRLEKEGIRTRVVDLRWIAPLPEGAILDHARSAAAVLVVDECRRAGNVSEAIAACILDDPEMRRLPFARVTSADSFVPIGRAADLVLAQEGEIARSATRLARQAR